MVEFSGIMLNRNGMAKLAGIMNRSRKDLNWYVTSIRMRVVYITNTYVNYSIHINKYRSL